MSKSSSHFLLPDLPKLRKNIQTASGLEKKTVDLLYRSLNNILNDKRRNYDLHWVMVFLIEKSEPARQHARNAVWDEIMEGKEKRPGHFWDSPNFLAAHFWIASAIAAHAAIAMDWLATEKVFNRGEVKQMGERLVNGFWQKIYPHLKGRGRAPIYVEPMNQDSAMVAGCLIIGYLFGYKWSNSPLAKKMYADARVLAGNLMGQFFTTGFDNDGFTYMRIIQAQVICLISMVIEEVENSDFYFHRFEPNGFSAANFMEKLQRFTLPSGSSFPYGRYGYVRDWGMYAQAYASHKTGEAHYLERALQSTQTDFRNPWIAMDLPLAIAWQPFGTEPGTPRKKFQTEYLSWHDPQIWSNLGAKSSRTFVNLCWRMNGQATYLAEHREERCVIHSSEKSNHHNGLFFPEWQPNRSQGKNFRYYQLCDLQMSVIDITPQWNSPELEQCQKALMLWEDGLVLALDWYKSKSPVKPVAHLNLINKWNQGGMESESGKNQVNILFTYGAPDAISENEPNKKRRVGFSHLKQLPRSGAQVSGTLIDFASEKISSLKISDGEVTWKYRNKPYRAGINFGLQNELFVFGRSKTDARMVLHWEGKRSLLNCRRWREGKQSLWSTCNIDLTRGSSYIQLDGLNYGNYFRYKTPGVELSVLRGTGYDIYYKVAKPMVLNLPASSSPDWLQVNGKKAVCKKKDGRLELELKPFPAKKSTGLKNISGSGVGSVLQFLNEVLQYHQTSRLNQVRKLLDHQDMHVRLFASDVLGYLGEDKDAELIAAKMLNESEKTSEVGGSGPPWHGKWAFFPVVTVMADALRRLGNPNVIPGIEKCIPLQVEPHAIDSLQMAMNTLKIKPGE